MFGLFTPVLILDAICVYHAYRNNAEQRWYWFILFFPVIGSLIYLYDHFSRAASINTISEGVKEVVNNNYKLLQLEKELKITDNVTNKVNLADAYVEFNRYPEAIQLYRDTLTGFMEDDPVVRMKLLQALYLNKDFTAAIEIGFSLEKEKLFAGSPERVMYAWALHFSGNSTACETIFESLDRSFTNYAQRLEYCKFLHQTGASEKFKERLAELIEEFHLMKGRERKVYKHIRKEVEALHQAFSTT